MFLSKYVYEVWLTYTYWTEELIKSYGENKPQARVGPDKKKKIELAQVHTPKKWYQYCHISTAEEKSDQEQLKKRSWEKRNMSSCRKMEVAISQS